MINWLAVSDFVVVRNVEVVFGPGMTVLTGETGAGKSLIVDAMAILLGDRTSADVIHPGSKKSEIQGCFDVSKNHRAKDWLSEQQLVGDDGECILRRLVFRDKASRGFVNGRPVPIQSLRAIGALLVDIHGQHEHHLLLRGEVQRATLDAYAGIRAQVATINEVHGQFSETNELLKDLKIRAAQEEERTSFVRHQVAELEALEPDPDEWHNLDQRQTLLAHTRELAEGVWQSLQQLRDDETLSALTSLSQARARLHDIAKFDTTLTLIAAELEELETRLSEAANDLQRRLERYELDPDEYARVQSRLSVLHDAARKFRVQPEALADTLRELHETLEDTTASGSRIATLEETLCALGQRYDTLASEITRERHRAVKRLSDAVTSHLAELGLEQADFKAELTSLAADQRHRHGMEQVHFSVRTHAEMTHGPLAKVASGGELSRISLALQVVTSAVDPVPISIFDEVDVGIGGSIAEIVGSKLRTLGRDRQVLCITHLPQVAVQGEGHLRVTKSGDNQTEVAVETLDERDRVEEIARMLGGLTITQKTLAHARDMLTRAAL